MTFGRHGEGNAITIHSLKVSDILSQAKSFYGVHGNAILMREVKPTLFVECSSECVNNESCLALEPEYFNARFQFQTLTSTKSLRLLTKRVAKASGKISGRAKRVSGILIEIEVHAVDCDLIENFLVSMQNTQGIAIDVKGIKKWTGHGVLHGKFLVENSDIKRTDNQESFDREEDVSSEMSYDFYS